MPTQVKKRAMDFFGLGGVVFVVGILFFFTKYIVVYVETNVQGRVIATARFCLVVATICVLLLPHELCSPWALPKEQSFTAAVIVVVGELWSAYCHARCGAALCLVTLTHCMLHANDTIDIFEDNRCTITFASISVVGALCCTVLFAVQSSLLREAFDTFVDKCRT